MVDILQVGNESQVCGVIGNRISLRKLRLDGQTYRKQHKRKTRQNQQLHNQDKMTFTFIAIFFAFFAIKLLELILS